MIDGVRGLNKKSEGPGIMGSGTQDELRGFGFRCSARELERVNAWRLVKYDGKKPPLVMSPGLRFLKYGKNNAGYWNSEQFAEQCQAPAPFLFSVLTGGHADKVPTHAACAQVHGAHVATRRQHQTGLED